MLTVNIFIIILSLLIIGGFLDFLWHTGKLLHTGENGVTRALFLFFLALLFATPRAFVGAILESFDLYDKYSDQMQVWLLIILAVLLAAMINLRITLFGNEEK